MTGELLIRDARPLNSNLSTNVQPVDLRIIDGKVVSITPAGQPVGNPGRVIHADGRWLIPGLWDHHVHMTQWAELAERLDASGTKSAAEVVDRVRAHVETLNRAGDTDSVIMGAGHRSSAWDDRPSVAALDAVSGAHPVVLISGDGHNGWLNSKALAVLGVPPRNSALDENEWFAVLPRVELLPKNGRPIDALCRAAMADAASRGIVGITDLEFADAPGEWVKRVERGFTGLRVRAGFYPDALHKVLAGTARTGDRLADLIELGPLKIISDGSLGTLTAYCCEPYAAGTQHPNGKQNFTPAELKELLSAAAAHRLDVALHAIGDHAVSDALDVFQATGAKGTIEHAQLVRISDVARMAELGLTASVQPAHLLDDRDVTERVWADRAERCFTLRSMADAGVPLALGSDAPVAPLDPWLAIDAAVYRARPNESPWNETEQLTLTQALFSSTNGRTDVGSGSVGDVVLLDHHPDEIRPQDMKVAATIVNGEVVYDSIDG